MGRLNRVKGGRGVGQLAGKTDKEARDELFEILLKLRGTAVRRAVVTWKRRQGAFGGEILALTSSLSARLG